MKVWDCKVGRRVNSGGGGLVSGKKGDVRVKEG